MRQANAVHDCTQRAIVHAVQRKVIQCQSMSSVLVLVPSVHCTRVSANALQPQPVPRSGVRLVQRAWRPAEAEAHQLDLDPRSSADLMRAEAVVDKYRSAQVKRSQEELAVSLLRIPRVRQLIERTLRVR